MRRKLHLHPQSRSTNVSEIEVEADRPGHDMLHLRYFVSGKIGNLILPPIRTPARSDGLWRHTCFEAFLRVSPGTGYCEFNFAPSTHWAAYLFEGYRSGQRDLETAAPRIGIRADAATLELRAVLQMSADTTGKLGLAAVIEETSGNLTYWALGHTSGGPDFHCDGNFALALPLATRIAT